MQSEHAYAMLQGITGESFFIQAVFFQIYFSRNKFFSLILCIAANSNLSQIEGLLQR